MSNDFALNCEGLRSPDYDTDKIAQVAAYIVSSQGENAIDHALRLEAQSAVPELAKRVRERVEHLFRTSSPTSVTETTVNLPS